MAGPWEKYQSGQTLQDGPWKKYSTPAHGVDAVPKDITLAESMVPNTTAYYEKHPDETWSIGAAKEAVKDLGKNIISVPKGITDYAVGKVRQGLGGKDPGTLAQNIASTGDTFMDKLLRSPGTGATVALGGPIGALSRGVSLGGSMLGRLATPAARLATEGAISGATGAEVEGQNPLAGAVAGGVMGPLAGGILGAPGAIARGIRGIGQAGERVIPGGALQDLQDIVRGPATPPQVNPYGIQLSPSQANRVTEGIKPALELTAQTNPFLQDIPAQLQKANETAIPKAILERRNQLANPIGSPSDMVPSAIGGRIEEMARGAKEGIGQQFAQGQEKALYESGAAKLPLPAHTASEKGRKGLSSKQEIVEDVENTLRNLGYVEAKGFTGQELASKNAINYLREQKNLLGNAKTTEDLLRQKRRIAADVYADSRNTNPLFQDRDHAVLSAFERKLDDRIGEQFDHLIGSGPGELPLEQAHAAKNLWDATNLEYYNNRGILEAVDKGLGISSRKTNPEEYFRKVREIGVDNLASLRNAAQKNEAMQPLFRELQAGFFDNFLKNTLNPKSLEISPDRLMTQWRSMDQGLKAVMVPDRVAQEMDEIVDLVGRTQLNNARVMNPSGTARLGSVLGNIKGAIQDPQAAITAMLFRGPVKEYYATGHAPSLSSILSIIDRVRSTGSRTAEVLDHVQGGFGLSSPRTRALIGRAGIYGAQE